MKIMKFPIILIAMMFLVSSSNTFRRKRQIIFPDSDLWKKIMSSSAAENPDFSPAKTNENPDLSTKTNKNPGLITSKTNENPVLSTSKTNEYPNLSSKTNKNPDLSPSKTYENLDLSTKANENPDLLPSKTNENPDLLPKIIENPKSNVKFEPRVVNGIRKPKNQVGFATPIITTKKAHYIYQDKKLNSSCCLLC